MPRFHQHAQARPQRFPPAFAGAAAVGTAAPGAAGLADSADLDPKEARLKRAHPEFVRQRLAAALAFVISQAWRQGYREVE
jgi:hypothetical protein